MQCRRPRHVSALLLTGSLCVAGLVLGPPAAEATPTIKVSTVVDGLALPWDFTWVDGALLYDQRAGGIWSKRGSADPQKVSIPLPEPLVSSEGGLLGMVADPDAASKRFYTCQTATNGSAADDVRVLRWRLESDTSAVADGSPNTVVTGIPVTSGRHTGCRLRFGPDGKLYVGTGDAATATNPQNLQNLGGKVLRVNRDGSAPSDNPFYGRGGNARYVWNYGHRNVQGLALRPGTTELWSAEQGTGRDDEVNLVSKGANYGWDPIPKTGSSPAYDESNDMTDLAKFSDAVPARWSSGNPTVAASGLTFLTGAAWGRWEGAAAVAMLKDEGITLLFLDPHGALVSTTTLDAVHSYGRIRSVQMGPDGALWFSTSNGSGDVIAKVTPTGQPKELKRGESLSSVGVAAARTADGTMWAFVKSTGDRVYYRRSTDDGHTWPSGWAGTGLSTARPPSAASAARGQVDLVTTDPQGVAHYTRFDGTRRAATVSLGGHWQNLTISSLGDKTLDVFGLGLNGSVYRKHFDGRRWTSWTRMGNETFSAAVGASAAVGGTDTLVTARGLNGGIYELTAGRTSVSRWHGVSGRLWSARALGDRFASLPLVSVTTGSDGYLRYQSGSLAQGLAPKLTSDADVVTRPDGTWVAFGRDDRGLVYLDDRAGENTGRSLGGIVR